MNSNIFDKDQFNNNTWDEDSNQICCESPVLFGVPYHKKIDDNELSIIHLQYHSDTAEEQYSQEDQFLIPNTQKKIQKISRKYKSKGKKKSNTFKNMIEEFVSFVHFSGENTNQQIHYCQKMRKMIDNLEGILFSMKQEILSQYQKKNSINN
ncbi:unnamed protein product [Paramecium pentaurelia]|uniref:Uncharacterized protein n=1 Tax=Paramecium pentaurelia TaxID=43138 RepID=A0A8S1TB90_9CILI|nr:unnamed protein product [Paramecium pentaurelia]